MLRQLTFSLLSPGTVEFIPEEVSMVTQTPDDF